MLLLRIQGCVLCVLLLRIQGCVLCVVTEHKGCVLMFQNRKEDGMTPGLQSPVLAQVAFQ